MELGRRISFIRRGVFCLPPGFFAKILGITKQELLDIEAGRKPPSDSVFTRVTIITKTTRGWFLGTTPSATVNNWGYFELPFPGIEKLGKAATIPLQDILNAWTNDAPYLFEENGSPPCFIAEIENTKWRFLVIPFEGSGAVIFKVNDEVWPVIQSAIRKARSRVHTTITVSPQFASKIGSPRQSHTDPDAVIALFELLGLPKLASKWRINCDEIRQCVWRKEKPEYLSLLTKLAELLGDTELCEGGVHCEVFDFSRDQLEQMRPQAWIEELGLDKPRKDTLQGA